MKYTHNILAVAVALAGALTAAAPSFTAAAQARKYDCTKLITDAEMRTATGLPDAALVLQRPVTDTAESEEPTSCLG